MKNLKAIAGVRPVQDPGGKTTTVHRQGAGFTASVDAAVQLGWLVPERLIEVPR